MQKQFCSTGVLISVFFIDFISLELLNGKPKLLMSYGTGVSAVMISQSSRLDNDESQKISIDWSENVSFRSFSCAPLVMLRACCNGIFLYLGYIHAY